jgi:hypothetical protein
MKPAALSGPRDRRVLDEEYLGFKLAERDSLLFSGNLENGI